MLLVIKKFWWSQSFAKRTLVGKKRLLKISKEEKVVNIVQETHEDIRKIDEKNRKKILRTLKRTNPKSEVPKHT